MANISAFASKAMLDWTTGAAAPPTISFRYVGLAIGTPGTGADAASEMGSNTMGAVRQTVLVRRGSFTGRVGSNTAAMTFGPFSSVGSVLGAHLWMARRSTRQT